MTEQIKTPESEEEVEQYGDKYIATADAHVPLWLKVTYIIFPIWGVIWMVLYWNGSYGWLDRGYWRQLEIAANTTFPSENQSDPQEDGRVSRLID